MNDDYKKEYETLIQEYTSYQKMAEQIMQNLNDKNIKLEQKINAFTNIVLISNHINQNLNNQNLLELINDSILGLFGATYSTIYILSNNKLNVSVTNIKDSSVFFEKENLINANNFKTLIVNKDTSIFSTDKNIHSILGVPIEVRGKNIGYILLEHTILNFFSNIHEKLLKTISNQIGISIDNNILYNKVKIASTIDPLMKIYNRRSFFEIVNAKIKSGLIDNFAIIMIDIDNFKLVNDNYGHLFGDAILRDTAKLFKNSTRDETDVLARYGGEELILFLSNFNDRDGLIEMIDQIRVEISQNTVTMNELSKNITISLGMYISEITLNINELEGFINKADQMLYKSKENGRNRLTVCKES